MAVLVLVPGCSRGEDEPVPARPSSAQARPAPDRGSDPARLPAPARLDPPLPAGRVRVQEGPFSDRVSFSGLRLERGRRPAVHGRVRNVVDVSEVIVLELRADFYDRRGRLVGTGVSSRKDLKEFADHPLRFRIRSPEPARAAAGAVLSVPQLVNE